MFQRKPSRFRRRPNNGRSYRPHGTSMPANRSGSNSFSSGQPRNNYRPTLSPEKSFEKYSLLAKEATSSGDNTLSENYLQHADHYMRVIEDRNKIRSQNKVQTEDSKSSTSSESINQTEDSKNLTSNESINQNKEITN
jgi:hypothetical protein